VIGFHEKVDHPPGNLANGAIYLLSSKFFQILATEFRDASCFSTQILPKLMGRIYTYKTNAPLIDIGSPEAYIKANQLN
jgi:mannose-1-phosphate guanylyltransferase